MFPMPATSVWSSNARLIPERLFFIRAIAASAGAMSIYEPVHSQVHLRQRDGVLGLLLPVDRQAATGGLVMALNELRAQGIDETIQQSEIPGFLGAFLGCPEGVDRLDGLLKHAESTPLTSLFAGSAGRIGSSSS